MQVQEGSIEYQNGWRSNWNTDYNRNYYYFVDPRTHEQSQVHQQPHSIYG